MKLLQFILIAIFLLSGFASCKKLKGDENKEVTYGGGRVVLINSDTPVPLALVRFVKWQTSSGLGDPMSYVEIASEIADSNGYFEIPLETEATMAIAYGYEDVYDRPSETGNILAYIEQGGELKLQLVPPAWIKVSAVDVEPLNPEIDYVKGSPNTGNYIDDVSLETPQLWEVDGQVEQYISYYFQPMNATINEIFHYHIPPPLAFDTTEYIIEY